MNVQRGFVLACYLIVFVCVWGIIACLGGEHTKHSFRDLCANVLGLAISIGLLWLEACYG